MNGLDLKKIDWAITTTILILLSISVAFIYSAQFQSVGSVGSTWQRQIFFGLFGIRTLCINRLDRLQDFY